MGVRGQRCKPAGISPPLERRDDLFVANASVQIVQPEPLRELSQDEVTKAAALPPPVDVRVQVRHRRDPDEDLLPKRSACP